MSKLNQKINSVWGENQPYPTYICPVGTTSPRCVKMDLTTLLDHGWKAWFIATPMYENGSTRWMVLGWKNEVAQTIVCFCRWISPKGYSGHLGNSSTTDWYRSKACFGSRLLDWASVSLATSTHSGISRQSNRPCSETPPPCSIQSDRRGMRYCCGEGKDHGRIEISEQLENNHTNDKQFPAIEHRKGQE